jgi:hypothetical protein
VIVGATVAGGVTGLVGAAFTVRIAPLLVALPALLLTVTANCVLLFEVVSAGVV